MFFRRKKAVMQELHFVERAAQLKQGSVQARKINEDCDNLSLLSQTFVTEFANLFSPSIAHYALVGQVPVAAAKKY